MFHYLSFIKLSWANQNFLEPLASSLIVFVYKRNFVMLFKSFSYKNKTFLSPNLQNIVLIVVVCIVLFVASRQLREILLIWLVNKALFHKSFKQSIKTLFFSLFVVQEVTCLEFHPKEAILASGSNDFTIKLFDYSKASAKKAFRTMTDAAPLTCMSFHPSGDFLVAGTATPILRLYDVNTSQCFISAIPSHHHGASINAVK